MTKSNLLISHFYANFHAFDKKHVLIVYKIDILVNQLGLLGSTVYLINMLK